jgi:Family of unknown function (DUF6027)
MTDDRPPDRSKRAPAEETVVLQAWTGPFEPDDPDANYKAEIALYANQDPMETLRGLSQAIDVPLGAIARYVLARYATTGSGGLLELGPTMVHRLWDPIAAAEMEGTDQARLAAFEELRGIVSWLRLPLVEDGGYPAQDAGTT